MGSKIASAIAMLATLLAGCGAKLDENVAGDGSVVDVPGPTDATTAPSDAAIDARLCAGGDARATDPATGSCFVWFTAPATYPAANAACTAFGAKLAIIKAAQTNATVLSLIGMSDAFLGGTDAPPATEGAFLWRGNAADPVTAVANYTNWRAGEPNNGGAGSTVEEDCMIIEGARGGTWDDRPCAPPPVGAGSYSYVCQF
ncbi:MAG: hemicentin [Myxococcales bacterium]|nr:hemicentin [Myxococcales bacterium]